MVVAVLIVGAGGFGQSVADAIASGERLAVGGFLDDRGSDIGQVLGHAVLGRVSDLSALRHDFAVVVVAIGDNARRRELSQIARAAGFELAMVVHPKAFVSVHAQLGAGTMVMAGAIVGTEAHIGEGVIVNAGAVVDHHACVGDFAHLGVGACMGGGAKLGTLAWLQEGAVLRAGQEAAPGSVVSRSAP